MMSLIIEDDEKASVAELSAIAERAAAQVEGSYVDHDRELYDEDGLPK